MKDIHGEHISLGGAAGQWHGVSPLEQIRPRRTGQLYETVDWERCWERASSQGVSRGRQAGGRRGRSWHLMDRLCVFSCECGKRPTRGNFQLVSRPLYWEYSLTTLQPPKHSKAGKRRALAADQQDIFTLEESICFCKMAPVSSRMFGNRSGTFLALGHSDILSHLIFFIFFSFKLERGAAGQDAAGGRPTCVRVDEPQGSGQQGPDHEGRKGDAHHRRSVQHVQRVWRKRRRM